MNRSCQDCKPPQSKSLLIRTGKDGKTIKSGVIRNLVIVAVMENSHLPATTSNAPYIFWKKYERYILYKLGKF